MNRSVYKFHGQILLLLLLLLLSVEGRAQFFTVGSDPAALKWSQININQLRLIFPDREPGLALRFSAALNNLGPVTASMKSDIRKLPFILHPYTSFSNGTSVMAPRRIELFPKQPLALETNDFITQLVIHEYRHFAQMERLNSGFTKVLGWFLGDQAQSIVLGIHVPPWLLEGDAVLTETLLSPSGRGRIAGFIQPLRSRLIDNKDLSFDRLNFGSYNDVLPDDYLFGYFLVARGRMLADPLLWSDALGQIGRNPINFRGLSGITKPKTGYDFDELLVETFEWLRDYWTDPKLTVKSPDGLTNLVNDTTTYENYYRPQPFSDHEVICFKKSIRDTPAFVLIDSTENETVITRPGNIEDAGFAYSSGHLVWAELITDPRWENRSWSDLFLYDMNSRVKQRLTHRQRYFSPAFNASGTRLAVIEEKPDGSSWLCILDPVSGKVLESILNIENEHYSYFCWGKGPHEIIAITTGKIGRKLVLVNLELHTQEDLFDAGYADITSPAQAGIFIYFAGPAGAAQGLYRVNPFTRRVEFVFGHPHGINYISVVGENLYLSVYSSDGCRPAKMPMGKLAGKAVSRIEQLAEPVTAVIQRAEGEFPAKNRDTATIITPSPYHKILNLFRLHSWSPVFVNPDSYQISPGVVMMSQNDLSTLTSWAGYQWNTTDHSENIIASFRYTGFYPALSLTYHQKFHYPKSRSQLIQFGAGLPLSYSSGTWTRKINPGLSIEGAKQHHGGDEPSVSSAWLAGISLSAGLLRNMSYRDLFPKWGASLNLSYFKTLSSIQPDNNYVARLMLYFPGPLPNSSLRLLNSARYLSFEQEDISYNDFPRGHEVRDMLKYYNFKADYAFPISYPDYHLSGIIYIKRIKANVFFDAGTPLTRVKWIMTTGLDVTFNYNFLRIGIALESGIRMMYFPLTRKVGAEFLYSFAIN